MASLRDFSMKVPRRFPVKNKPLTIAPPPVHTDLPFVNAFRYFSNFGKSGVGSTSIDYDQINVWLTEASIIDGVDVTFYDVAACLYELAPTLSFSYFDIFVFNLSKRVGTRYSILKKKLCEAKYPNGSIGYYGTLKKIENCFCGSCGLYRKMIRKPKTCLDKFNALFTTFAKFGKSKSDGKYINLTQIDKWMKQASIFDGRIITTADTAIHFIKKRRCKMDFAEFIKFLDDMARAKRIDANELKQKLWRCGPPKCNGIGAQNVRTPGFLARLVPWVARRMPASSEQTSKRKEDCPIL